MHQVRPFGARTSLSLGRLCKPLYATKSGSMKEIDLRVEGVFSKRVWVLYLVGLPFFLSAIMLGLILDSEFHPALFLVVVFISEPLFIIIYVSTYKSIQGGRPCWSVCIN